MVFTIIYILLSSGFIMFIYDYVLYPPTERKLLGDLQKYWIYIALPLSVHEFLIPHFWILKKFQPSEIILHSRKQMNHHGIKIT